MKNLWNFNSGKSNNFNWNREIDDKSHGSLDQVGWKQRKETTMRANITLKVNRRKISGSVEAHFDNLTEFNFIDWFNELQFADEIAFGNDGLTQTANREIWLILSWTQ